MPNRALLPLIIALALFPRPAAAATARQDLELAPRPLYTELAWDDGQRTNSYFGGEAGPFATTFIAPFRCKILTYRFYWYSYNGADTPIHCYLFGDDGSGTPTHESEFDITGSSGGVDDAWFDVDISAAGIILEEGELFHPGWDFGVGGPFWGLYVDDAKGGGSCWTTGFSGDWIDIWADTYTHMMRVVVRAVP